MLDRVQTDDIFYDGTFIDVLHSICLEKVPQVDCDNQKENVVAILMYFYFIVRFKCVARANFLFLFCLLL